MKLSRTVRYAVQASVQLAQSDPAQPVPCSRLAAQGRMPERFLLQILRSLVTHGILRSSRGVDGGYVLERPADEVSLLDLIEAIDGSLLEEGRADDALADETLTAALREVTAVMRHELDAIKLSQLVPPKVDAEQVAVS
ncbi:MAG: Rrf2 family transcriptional regulator [Pirellulales bacterium]|nr:Rrf2 family transcriptional regulator [Pirellulales bacterium]